MSRKRVDTLDMTDEEYLTEQLFPTNDTVPEEAWPITPEDYAREFERYLEDIGVRI